MIAAHSTDQEEWRLGGGGASKSPLGWALPQHHQDTGGGDRERGGEGRQQRGSGEGKRLDVTLASAYLPLLSPRPAVATDSSCPSWPLARQLAPLLTPEPQTDGAPDTR